MTDHRRADHGHADRRPAVHGAADASVVVQAPARLHLGFLDPGGGSGRRFGSIGLALEAPETRLRLQRADADAAEGPDGDRALATLSRLRADLGLSGAHRVTVEEAIPPHTGLGSGTQAALAAALALRRLEGLAPDVRGDCVRLDRGHRSGLGAAFMETGGLAVDGGKGAGPAPPPIVASMAFPPEWRVILVFDAQTDGLHGQDELDAFAALPPFPEESVAAICQLVLTGVLPALAERDLGTFGAAIRTIQRQVGEHFAPAQGGVFSSPRVADALATLDAAGAHGSGQSSWGPTGFCFAETLEAAERLVGRLEAGTRQAGAGTPGRGVTTRIVSARAGGARVQPAPPRDGKPGGHGERRALAHLFENA